MKTTKNELKLQSESRARSGADAIHSSVSGPTSEVKIQPESSGLSKSLAMQLMGLITDVNKDGVTPETVNASCNAASQIYKLLRLNYEMKKDGF